MPENPTTTRFKRILLKLSGEALMGDNKYGISPKVLEQVAEEIRDVIELGVEIGVVIGGGNIFRGVSASTEGMDRASADYMGMLATVINSLALQDSLEKRGVYTRVQSAIEMHSADPVKDPSAERYTQLSYLDLLKKNLKVMDSTAISLCMDNDLPIIVFDLGVRGNILRVVRGEAVGTTVGTLKPRAA